MRVSDSIVRKLAYLNRIERYIIASVAAFKRNMERGRLLDMRPKNLIQPLAIALAALIVALFPMPSHAGPSSSRTELTPPSSGPGSVDFLRTDNICRHCHPSHNPQNSVLDESQASRADQTTLRDRPGKKAPESLLSDSVGDEENILPLQRSSTRLCLSCHDGVTAKAPGGGDAEIMRKIMEYAYAAGDAMSLQRDVPPFLSASVVRSGEMNIANAACIYYGTEGEIEVKCSACHDRLCQRRQMSENADSRKPSCLSCHEK